MEDNLQKEERHINQALVVASHTSSGLQSRALQATDNT
jgi:hypothetical protein